MWKWLNNFSEIWGWCQSFPVKKALWKAMNHLYHDVFLLLSTYLLALSNLELFLRPSHTCLGSVWFLAWKETLHFSSCHNACLLIPRLVEGMMNCFSSKANTLLSLLCNWNAKMSLNCSFATSSFCIALSNKWWITLGSSSSMAELLPNAVLFFWFFFFHFHFVAASSFIWWLPFCMHVFLCISQYFLSISSSLQMSGLSICPLWFNYLSKSRSISLL